MQKQKWFAFWDKPNCALACLLDHKSVMRMRKADGTMTMNPAEKLNIFADYYETLYASSNTPLQEMEEFLDKLDIPQLAEEDQVKLKEPVQLIEIVRVVNSLKLNKSPGWIDCRILQKISGSIGQGFAEVLFRMHSS